MTNITLENEKKALRVAINGKRTACKLSLYNFLVFFWDTIIQDEFVDNWHIKYICDEIQKVAENVFARKPLEYNLIINVPPGTSKSTICTIMLPAWCWVRDPTTRIISGSYAADLAIEHAVKSRDLLKSDKFRFIFGNLINFKQDMDLKKSYENTRGGARIIAATGGQVTGRHGHLIIIDDPINPKQSLSDVERQNATNWIDNTLSSRKIDKKMTPTILIMQRLAEDDPTGHQLEKDGVPVKHICLPAEITDLDNIKPHEMEKFYTEGLLDKNRMDKITLRREKINMGSRQYAGQYLQSPVAAEGNLLKREWWSFYEILPMEKPIRTVQSWDTAFKKGQENDYSVCTTWKQFQHGFYLIGFFAEKLEYPQLKIQVDLLYNLFKPNNILIEEKGSGISVIQDLKQNSALPITGIKVDSDKIARANMASPMIEARNVYLPTHADYTERIIEQCSGFPNVKFDDIVDSITQFINWARENPSFIPQIYSKQVHKKSILRGFHHG